ncbi:MAG: hypothetical protein ACIAS6_04000 [Phycisphaerales bacterium JB060]
MSDDHTTSPQPTNDAERGEPMRFPAGEGGPRVGQVLDVGAYVRCLRATLEGACTQGRPTVMNMVFVDSPDPAPQFAFVPMGGLTTAQAEALVKQWHLDVCDALGVDPEPRPAPAPTLALNLLEGLAETADRERDGQPTDPGPDDPGGGAA